MSVRCQEAGGRKRVRDCLDEKRRSTLNLDCEVAEERKLFICGGNVGIHQTNTLFSSVHEVEQLCLLPCGNQLGSFYACYRVWILSSSLIFLYCFLFSCSSHCLVLHMKISIHVDLISSIFGLQELCTSQF